MTPGWPSNRYAEIALKVRDLCEWFGFRYNTGSLAHLTVGVWKPQPASPCRAGNQPAGRQ
ncbi:hypothetical protein GCM10010170_010550 [Dactylosporangium salmoneum]|uniref:Uncharacterized protein n=1 Tax=Dactylosporangium salmoneum TaxID=53361 RepID=A0ABP5SIE8_9ACTN